MTLTTVINPGDGIARLLVGDADGCVTLSERDVQRITQAVITATTTAMQQLAELRAAVATLRGVETHLRMATNQRHAGYKHSGHWHAADVITRVLALLPPLPPTKP